MFVTRFPVRRAATAFARLSVIARRTYADERETDALADRIWKEGKTRESAELAAEVKELIAKREKNKPETDALAARIKEEEHELNEREAWNFAWEARHDLMWRRKWDLIWFPEPKQWVDYRALEKQAWRERKFEFSTNDFPQSKC